MLRLNGTRAGQAGLLFSPAGWLMNSLGTMRLPRLLEAGPSVRERGLNLTDALLPVAVALWALGVSMVDTRKIGPLGLPAVLPLVFYAGLAILVISAAIELCRTKISGWRMSLHSIALVVMLYGTAPLVYREGRYSWLYKTVGVVQYIKAHGSVNSHIDIYQNWPGFFAFAAWFDRVAGITTPLAYAKWAQLVFELAALPLLYLIYDALRLTTRQRWVAMLLFSSSNWIGQDYFSPQALGTVLSLGIMAIAMRWLFIHRPPRESLDVLGTARSLLHVRLPQLQRPRLHWPQAVTRRRHGTSRADVEYAVIPASLLPAEPIEPAEATAPTEPTEATAPTEPTEVTAPTAPTEVTVPTEPTEVTASTAPAEPAEPTPSTASTRTMFAACAALCVVFTFLTITHQLSPYMLVTQLGALALVGMLRPVWLPPVLLAIAVAYFAPRFGFVNSHFGLLKSLGAFFTNITPPSFSQHSVTPDQSVIQRSALLLSLAIWGLAVLGVWLRRRAGQGILALALLAFSPVVLLGLEAYGHEGILRVYLFSLPWSAALASSVLTPAAGRRRRANARSPQHGEAQARRPILPAVVDSLLAPAALLASLTLFIPAFFGDDAINVMSKQTVNTVTSFLRKAQPGPVLVPFDRAPVSDTANYNRFPLITIFGPNGILGTNPVQSTLTSVLAYDARKRANGFGPAYLIVTPTTIAYNNAYQLVNPDYFTTLLTELRHSRYWDLVVMKPGAVIYELNPLYLSPSAAPKHHTGHGGRKRPKGGG